MRCKWMINGVKDCLPPPPPSLFLSLLTLHDSHADLFDVLITRLLALKKECRFHYTAWNIPVMTLWSCYQLSTSPVHLFILWALAWKLCLCCFLTDCLLWVGFCFWFVFCFFSQEKLEYQKRLWLSKSWCASKFWVIKTYFYFNLFSM